MKVKPDDETLTALGRVGRGKEWKAIEAWLGKCREAGVQASFSADNSQSRQAQGYVMAIDYLITTTRAAVELSTRR